MDFISILQAGVASGTVLLFATLGEVLAERSGVLNLGVEGMMLIGAMSAYSDCSASWAIRGWACWLPCCLPAPSARSMPSSRLPCRPTRS